MKKQLTLLIAYILAGALLVSCGSQTASASAQNSPLISYLTAALDSSKAANAPVSSIDYSVIQYGHPDLISGNSGALLAYIRYPQADGFADSAIFNWAQQTCQNARTTIDAIRESNAAAEGEINIQFDSYLTANGSFAGVIEQGEFTHTGLSHPEDIIQTFNLDFQHQRLLDNTDILDYLRTSDILALLVKKLRAAQPESAEYMMEANVKWLHHLAVGTDGIIVILERGVCLPASFGSLRVTLPYEELGDLLLMDREPSLILERLLVSSPEPATQVSSAAAIDPSKPMLALTFDDGPSKYTPQILDLLEQHGGRATFCVIGNLVDASKETVRRAADMGCEIVGHSWDHRNLTMLSAEEIQLELTDTNKAIESAVGTAPKLYRPPYGAFNDELKDLSHEMGFGILSWSVDTQDWKTENADAVYTAVMKNASDRAIILNHDIYQTTADAMAKVIPELIAQGYQLVTVSELFQYCGISLEAGAVYHSGK